MFLGAWGVVVYVVSYSHDLGMAMLIGTSSGSTYGCGNVGR